MPEEEVRIIKNGVDFGRVYLRDLLGGDIGRRFRRSTTVKIVATGEGDPAVGGACCTASSAGYGARLFFDVQHPEFNHEAAPWGMEADKWKLAAHEYIHAWQLWLGCVDSSEAWLKEGTAEYFAYASLIEFDHMTPDDVRLFMLDASISTGEIEERLQDLEFIGEPYELWPGHIGYLAVEYLLSEYADGPEALRAHCEEIADGVSLRRAFKSAFGIRKSSFYRAFPEYLETLLSGGASPIRLAGRPTTQVRF